MVAMVTKSTKKIKSLENIFNQYIIAVLTGCILNLSIHIILKVASIKTM